VVTVIFLRPIFKILAEVGAGMGDVRSAGQISLEKTKWLTLLGASLTVLSSTAMYINLGLGIVLGGPGKLFYANSYLNISVFGINLDSVLNDVGMLLACGIIKKITHESVTTHLSIVAMRLSIVAPNKVQPEPALPPVMPAPQFAGAHAEPSMIFASQGDDQMD
jgi:hypothetical protein